MWQADPLSRRGRTPPCQRMTPRGMAPAVAIDHPAAMARATTGAASGRAGPTWRQPSQRVLMGGCLELDTSGPAPLSTLRRCLSPKSGRGRMPGRCPSGLFEGWDLAGCSTRADARPFPDHSARYQHQVAAGRPRPGSRKWPGPRGQRWPQEFRPQPLSVAEPSPIAHSFPCTPQLSNIVVGCTRLEVGAQRAQRLSAIAVE